MSPQFWSAKAIVQLTVYYIVAVQVSRFPNTAAGPFAPNYTLYPGSCKLSLMAVYVVSVKVGRSPCEHFVALVYNRVPLTPAGSRAPGVPFAKRDTLPLSPCLSPYPPPKQADPPTSAPLRGGRQYRSIVQF